MSSEHTDGSQARESLARPGARGPRPTGRPETGRLDVIALAIVLAVALALRLRGLAAHPPWLDEANTYVIARHAPGEILARLAQDSSPPLYYLFLHSWMEVFGASVTALRMPSVLFGLALIALVHRVGRTTFSGSAALWAAWLLATSPSQIHYSQQVRMYSLLPLLALLSTYALVRAFESGSWRRWSLYVLATAATLLTHNFGLHVLPVHVFVGLCAWRRGSSNRLYLLAGLAAGLLYLPWLPTFWSQLTGQDTYSWYAPFWEETSLKRMLLRTFDALGPGGRYFPETWTKPPGWLVVLTVVGLGLVVWGALAGARRPSPAPHWVTALLFLPIGTAVLLSWLVVPHYVPGRVDQMMIPAYALLAGAGLGALRLPRSAALVVAVIPLAAGVGVTPQHRPTPSPAVAGQEAELAREILARSKSGDAVVCTSLSRAPLQYLFEQAAADLRLLSYPRSTAEHMGGQDDGLLVAVDGLLQSEAQAVVSEALDEAVPGARVHVVLAGGEVNRVLASHLAVLVARGVLKSEGEPLSFAQRGTRQDLVLQTYARAR